MPQEDDVSADLAERLRFESLVIDLAAGFVNLEPERVDQAIEDRLRHIVEALHLDRSTLFQRSAEDLVVTHSWAAPGELAWVEMLRFGSTRAGSEGDMQ